MKIYKLLQEVYKGNFREKFMFHAANDVQALKLAKGYSLFHGGSNEDVKVEEYTGTEIDEECLREAYSWIEVANRMLTR